VRGGLQRTNGWGERHRVLRTLDEAISGGITPVFLLMGLESVSMVDCFDRIAVHMTELALEPVRQLKERRMLGSVSLRTPSNGHRFLVTIAKRLPNGDSGAPVFVWDVMEISATGETQMDGLASTCEAGTVFADPEEAYWAAVDSLCLLTN